MEHRWHRIRPLHKWVVEVLANFASEEAHADESENVVNDHQHTRHMQNGLKQVFHCLGDHSQWFDLFQKCQDFEESDEDDHVEPRYMQNQILKILLIDDRRVEKLGHHECVNNLANCFDGNAKMLLIRLHDAKNQKVNDELNEQKDIYEEHEEHPADEQTFGLVFDALQDYNT